MRLQTSDSSGATVNLQHKPSCYKGCRAASGRSPAQGTGRDALGHGLSPGEAKALDGNLESSSQTEELPKGGGIRESGPMGGVSIVTFCLPLLKEESFSGVGSGRRDGLLIIGGSEAEVGNSLTDGLQRGFTCQVGD